MRVHYEGVWVAISSAVQSANRNAELAVGAQDAADNSLERTVTSVRNSNQRQYDGSLTAALARTETPVEADASTSSPAEPETTPLIPYLHQQASRLTKQRADAEDLVQETLMKAFVSFESFRQGSNLRAWMYRIMVNAWVDGHRRRQVRPAELLTSEVGSVQSLGAVRTSGSAEAEALASLPSATDEALRELPMQLRTTIYYADVQGRPHTTEVATMLDIPVGTVGSRLHRGRGILRERLADHHPGSPGRSSA